MNDDRTYMTTEEVAELLRIGPKRVRELVAEGKIPYYALPGKRRSLRFVRKEIEEWMEKGGTD